MLIGRWEIWVEAESTGNHCGFFSTGMVYMPGEIFSPYPLWKTEAGRMGGVRSVFPEEGNESSSSPGFLPSMLNRVPASIFTWFRAGKTLEVFGAANKC